MAKKPPWLASTQAERKAMRDWVIAMLEAADEKEFDAKIRLLRYPNVQACIQEISRKQLAELRRSSRQRAIAEADRGNMGPLQEQHPELKRFLGPPKLEHGKHFEKDSEPRLLIKLAHADVLRIKELWKAEYGKCHRPKGQITAIEIAAYRWGIGVNYEKRRLRAAIVPQD